MGTENRVVLERSEKVDQLDGKEIPKLKKTESVISLLSEEESIAPIYDGFKRFIFTNIIQELQTVTVDSPEEIVLIPISLMEFKERMIHQPAVIKAYFLRELYLDEFNQIKGVFTDIFPFVKDIKINVTTNRKISREYVYSFNIKENNEWIPQSQMSFGLFRTLNHLIELSLAPQESVIVIDDFENGLGINCMPELTDFIMSKAPYLQFLLTSHHPYIISKIPSKTWKLVKRKGGHVSVINAIDIPQLQTGSRRNKFIQLVNLPEYEDGIL